MFDIDNVFYDDSVQTATLNPIAKSVTFKLNDGSDKTVSYGDDYADGKAYVEGNFVALSDTFFVNPRRVHHMVSLTKRVDVVVNGNNVYHVVFADNDARDEYIAGYADNFVQIGNRWYRLNLVHTAACTDATRTIFYVLDGNEAYSVTYEDADVYAEAKKKLGDFGSGGGSAPSVAKPVLSVESGWVDSGASLEITCSTEGATIHYTTDGSTPTKDSTSYSGAISITEDVTVKAIAIADGMKNSAVATGTYQVRTVDTTKYFKGWFLGSEPLEALTLADLTGLTGLESVVAESCNSPDPNTYEVPEGGLTEGGRIVWAYPASLGDINYVTDENETKNAIADSYTKQVLDVEGVNYNVYVLTTQVTLESGTVTATFTAE